MTRAMKTRLAKRIATRTARQCTGSEQAALAGRSAARVFYKSWNRVRSENSIGSRMGSARGPAARANWAASRRLNLGFTDWDERSRGHGTIARRLRLRSRLANCLWITLRQFHSDVIHVAGAPDDFHDRRAARPTH